MDWDELVVLCVVYYILYLILVEILSVMVILYKKYLFLIVVGERYGFILVLRLCLYVCVIVLWCVENGCIDFGLLRLGIVCYYIVYSLEI